MKKNIEMSLNFKYDKKSMAVWENPIRKTYMVNNYLCFDFKLDNINYKLKLKDFLKILKNNQEFLELFKVESIKIIKEMQEDLKTMKHKDFILKDSGFYENKDISITFYEEGYFCISILNENGKNNLIDIWENYLKEILEK